jgi:hypothetical protein
MAIYKVNPRKSIQNLVELPFPDISLIDLNVYNKSAGNAMVANNISKFNFVSLVEEIVKNNNTLPDIETLKKNNGLAFIIPKN